MKSSKQITDEYTNLCALLGNELIQFEIKKSNTLAQFQKLNQEMQEAIAREADEAAKLAAESEKLANDEKKLGALSLMSFGDK